MADLICRTTMMRCQTPGMCSPFGGCQPQTSKAVDLMRVELIDQLQAEVELLRKQVATLQSDPNSWQSGYDKGRTDGAKARMSELEQERRINAELSTEVEALRKDAQIDQIAYRGLVYRLRRDAEGGEFGISRLQRSFHLSYSSASTILEAMTERGDAVKVDGTSYRRRFPTDSDQA